MIRAVRGVVLQRGKDYLIVEVGNAAGGMGFKISTPEPTASQYREGDTVNLHTYLQVREDALALYGFPTEEELATFELLLSVNGVGPRVALATLSTLTPDALQLAIANDEPALVARVPGIGKRTAQKIVLELKDKFKVTSDAFVGLAQVVDEDSEVIEALTSLGYSVVEAQRALQKLPKDVKGVEERLRLALSQFSQ
ncbi:MAG: Holliday junction branch migration protein RuvA [Caldilineaceae bacterium]|nr:Holliday junction branch migration protein RuvA [Caldilineaceae bacterium]